MSKKISFKRAKVSGFLDILAFLFFLVLTAGYVVFDLVKVSAPEKLTNVWGKIENGVEHFFNGVCLDFAEKIPGYPGVVYTVLFAVLALIFLFLAIGVFKQSGSVLKKGGCLFGAILSLIFAAAFGVLFAEHFITGKVDLKWYVLVPAVYCLIQSILKFSSHARAY